MIKKITFVNLFIALFKF